MRLGEICTDHPSVDICSRLDAAMSLMTEEAVDSLVVLDKGEPAGVLSSFDVLERMVEGVEPERISVEELMSRILLKLESSMEVWEAADVMLAHKHWMAVVTEDGRYKGIVTAHRLLRASGLSKYLLILSKCILVL